jgi:hypothetical protein
VGADLVLFGEKDLTIYLSAAVCHRVDAAAGVLVLGTPDQQQN